MLSDVAVPNIVSRGRESAFSLQVMLESMPEFQLFISRIVSQERFYVLAKKAVVDNTSDATGQDYSFTQIK